MFHSYYIRNILISLNVLFIYVRVCSVELYVVVKRSPPIPKLTNWKNVNIRAAFAHTKQSMRRPAANHSIIKNVLCMCFDIKIDKVLDTQNRTE